VGGAKSGTIPVGRSCNVEGFGMGNKTMHIQVEVEEKHQVRIAVSGEVKANITIRKWKAHVI
jgi:hypothetical protein